MKGTGEQEGKGKRRCWVGTRRNHRGALTLAEMPEKHIKEGDIDGLVGSSVVFNLSQHHLQPNIRAGHRER
jgi:hypothetical protein